MLTTSAELKIKQNQNETKQNKKIIIKCICGGAGAGHIRFNRKHNLTAFPGKWIELQSSAIAPSHRRTVAPSHNGTIHLTGNKSRILVHRPHKLVLISSQGCYAVDTVQWAHNILMHTNECYFKIPFGIECEKAMVQFRRDDDKIRWKWLGWMANGKCANATGSHLTTATKQTDWKGDQNHRVILFPIRASAQFNAHHYDSVIWWNWIW